MKFNPFQPNGIVAPGMFSGRLDELRSIEQSLYQTRNGNPQHFLIQGERGIGKSSLLFYVEKVARGDMRSFGMEDPFRFVTVSVDLGSVETQLDIVSNIGRDLKRALARLDTLKQKASKVWDFLSKWEVMGVRYHKTDNVPADDARDDLVDSFADLVASADGEIDGALILLDEADSPPESAALGEFVKLFTERLTRRGCNNVLIGMAGLPSLIPRLRASHESSPRIFETLRLDPLEPGEREWVVQRGLEIAKQKNSEETKIMPDALRLICELSEGYPHFVQQFAYFAFAEDDDNTIDLQDVARGAYKENGALMQLGSKYFDEMYYARISSENYRKVLDSMAAHGDQWVSRKQIIAETDVKETTINNALGTLKTKNIILSDEARQGYYRLPTKSFAAWINAIKSVEKRAGTESTKSLFE